MLTLLALDKKTGKKLACRSSANFVSAGQISLIMFRGFLENVFCRIGNSWLTDLKNHKVLLKDPVLLGPCRVQ